MNKWLLVGWMTVLLLKGTVGLTQNVWDLRRCVDYAVTNNINVKQADIQAKIAALNVQRQKLQRWLSANFQSNAGEQFGRSIDPATNQFTNNQITFTQFAFSTSATLFNWFSGAYTIQAQELELKAQYATVEKWKNDISLNVAGAYLQVLLSREQIQIARVHLQQTREQLSNTKKLVVAGTLPELSAAELEAQLARDSSSYVNAETAYASNLLSLKIWMNYDPMEPLELLAPPVDQIPVENFADLQPVSVYNLALQNMPQQKVNQLRLQSLDRFRKAARSALYPTISAFGNLNSAYSSALEVLPKGAPVLTNVPIGLVTVDANTYTVVRPSLISTDFNKATFFRQLDFQFRQNLGLSLNVPIFNGGTAKTNWQRSKLNYQSQQLQVERDNLTLKQDITRAYNDATAAYQRYQASVKTVATAEYSFELTRKRYEAGLLRTIDLITNQNNLFRARLEQTANHFEYVFRMKVLEFYKGQGLKL